MKKEKILKLIKISSIIAAVLMIMNIFTFPIYAQDSDKGFLKFLSAIKGAGSPNFLKGANDVFVSGTKA
ncbi:hypothetical protein LLG07_07840 [bacterium]|nr:hypothetical protein [bacterium]